MKSVAAVVLIAAFSLSSAAFADDTAPRKDAKDPDRIICKSEEELGSRIARKKTCMTAAQWKEQRRLSRMEIERSQTSNYKNN